MDKIFIGTMRNGMKYCGMEFEEGTMTKEKWKIINELFVEIMITLLGFTAFFSWRVLKT